MSWGIWKKLKQGITKVMDFGKRVAKKVGDFIGRASDTAKKVLPTVTPILDSAGIDTSKVRDIQDKVERVQGALRRVTADHTANRATIAKIPATPAVTFGGKTWSPKILGH